MILVIVSIVLPWNIAFEGDELIEPKYFDPFVDITFIIDIIINFNTAFYKELNEKTILVTSRKEIAKNYIKGWFFLDIFSCLPLDYLSKFGAN